MGDDEQRAYTRELAKLGRAIREARVRPGVSEREVADAVRGVSLAGFAIEDRERPDSLRRDRPFVPCSASNLARFFVRAEGRSAE